MKFSIVSLLFLGTALAVPAPGNNKAAGLNKRQTSDGGAGFPEPTGTGGGLSGGFPFPTGFPEPTGTGGFGGGFPFPTGGFSGKSKSKGKASGTGGFGKSKATGTGKASGPRPTGTGKGKSGAPEPTGTAGGEDEGDE